VITRSPTRLAAVTDAAQGRARRREQHVMAAAHRFAWHASRLSARWDPDIFAVPGLGYVVSGAEALREVLLDAERFRKDRSASTGAIVTQVFGPCAVVNMEGTNHLELRGHLQGLLSPNCARRLVAEGTEATLGGVRARLAAGGPVEMASASKIAAAKLIVSTIRPDIHSLSDDRASEIHRATTRLAALISFPLRPLSNDALGRARDLQDELLGDVCGGPSSPGSGTVPGLLSQAGYSADEVRGVVAMLMIAGMETTSVALVRTAALLSDLGWWPRLHSNPERAESFVDEALRYVCPLPVSTRTVATDCEVRGHRLRAGRTLVGNLYHAVRDERVIERGDHFDPDRPVPPVVRHLWFGAGAHFCVGMPLARAFLVEAIGTLAEMGGVEVLERRAARRVLLPTYSRLLVKRRSATVRVGL